jgi:hypothetical protein
MRANENPAPRANAGSRGNSNFKRNHYRAFALDWEAEAATVWLAARFPKPPAPTRVLVTLESFGRAFR